MKSKNSLKLRKLVSMLTVLAVSSSMLTTFANAAGTPLPICMELENFTSGNVSSTTTATGGTSLLYSQGVAVAAPTTGGVLRLVDAPGNSTAGSVVRRNTVTLTGGFSTYFVLNMHDGTNPPADGLMFTLQANPTPVLGIFGAGLGFDTVPNSIGVEFDIWKNTGLDGSTGKAYNDPDNPKYSSTDINTANYVAIVQNGDNTHAIANDVIDNALDFNLYGGTDINVWVDYDGTNLTTYYGTSATRTDNRHITKNIGNYLQNKDIYAGFSAATGGSNSKQDIKRWYFSDSYVTGGLSSIAGTYTQGANSTKIVINGGLTNPSTASVTVQDTSNADMVNQAAEIYIDSTDKGVINTGTTGTGTYTFNNGSLTPGSHTIKAVAASGGTSSNTTFTVLAGNYTAAATATTLTPVVGKTDVITLTAKKSDETIDTSFTGSKNVTISGVVQAPDNSYGLFNATTLTASSQVVSLNFANGVASPTLVLDKVATHTIGFSIEGITTPATNTLSITPTAGAVTSTYTVTYTASANGTITGTTPQTINSGASATTVTAVPNAGYHFVNWSDGVTTVIRTDNNVITNINVTAIFAKTQYSGGGGLYTPTITANVVDTNNNNKNVQTVKATVTANTDGTDVVTVKPSDAIVMKQPDGTTSSFEDYSKVGYVTPANAPVTANSDGAVQVSNLAKGNNYNISVTYDMGNGQKITIGTIHITVDNSGNVNMTSNLIDPYGIVSDSLSGKVISGANVTLYYADTARNKLAKRVAGTVVQLPTINGFKPNNNQNPQVTDANGAYGFMVYPNTDYNVVVTKAGYDLFTSPSIFVGDKLVRFSAKLNPPVVGVKRVAGNTRVDTAIALAKSEYTGKVKSIIFAVADNFPDALTGSVLAYQQNAPILLVGFTQQEQNKVLDYMKNYMDTDGTVFLLGGTGVVTEDFANQVKSSGYTKVIRLGGADRYETATKIAEYLNVAEGTPVVIASGEGYPDALSVSSSAAVNQYPILLVTQNIISDSVKSELAKIKPTKIYIIGKQGAISDAVQDKFNQLTSLDSNSIVRLGGEDRYSTSIAVADYFKMSGKSACITTGTNFPDALAGSIYAANYNAPIILVGNSLTDEEKAYLQNSKLTGVTIFGGEGAVNSEVENEVSGLLSK